MIFITLLTIASGLMLPANFLRHRAHAAFVPQPSSPSCAFISPPSHKHRREREAISPTALSSWNGSGSSGGIERLEFTISPSGLVTEKVTGVTGPSCKIVTEEVGASD